MTNYNWQITQMNSTSSSEHENIVVTIFWNCSAEEDGCRGVTFGNVNIPLEGPDFTPYQDLTLDECLAWCWANGVDKTLNETLVSQQIEAEKAPPVVSLPLPWSVQQ